MSNSLNLPVLTGGQANPETTSNDADEQLANAITRTKSINLTSDATVSAADYRANIRFLVTTAGTGKILTLQAIARLVLVENEGGHDISVKVGTTTLTLANGDSAFYYTDGTANSLVLVGGGGGGGGGGAQPHDLHIFQPGKPDNSALIFRFNVVRAFTLPASLTGSVFNAGVAATGSSVFTIKQNGSSIGTITYSASGTTGTVSFASSVTFAINDLITITGQTTADATLADIAFDFLGSI